jgi:hypothetical protein
MNTTKSLLSLGLAFGWAGFLTAETVTYECDLNRLMQHTH